MREEEVSHESKLWGSVGLFVILMTLFVFIQNAGTEDWRQVSSVIGWMYFVAWSVSFYPQLILNWRRKSTEGLSYNFVWLNLLGFVCYSIFNAAFLWSDKVQQSYENAHDGNRNLVKINDVFFAIHASIVTLATLIQMYCFGYRSPKGVKVWRSVVVFLASAVGVAGIYLILVFSHGNKVWESGSKDNAWTMLSWLYFVSYIKLVISFLKYVPQVHLNYKLKSTQGWSLHNVLLDFTGGLLSFVQLFIDAAIDSNWSGVFGDPVKLGLSILSLVFDIIFMVQHFVLYHPSRHHQYTGVARHQVDDENLPLTQEDAVALGADGIVDRNRSD